MISKQITQIIFIELINLPDEEYSTISKNCLDMAKNEFDFNKQIYRCYDFIKSI